MKDYKNYYTIQGPPDEVYLALTNPFTIGLWTGEDNAIMSTEAGSEFSIMGESIEGKNLEFIENKKIVQQWYFGDDEETPSIVTLKLHDHKEGTSIELNHTNIPDEAYQDIVDGWNAIYFKALRDFF